MRIPRLAAEQMTPRQRELSERIAGRRGQTRGPFLVWLHSPGLCDRVEALGAFVRYECSLSEKLREFSLLIAARHFDAQYSWNAHVERALSCGLDPEVVKALADKRAPAFTAQDEKVFYALCREMLEDHFVSDATFEEAVRLFGVQGVVDAVGCIGNFSMLAMCLNTFQVDLQPERQPPFPDVRGYAKLVPQAAAAAGGR